MPVLAVTFAGKERLSSGSAKIVCGRNPGVKIIFLILVISSEITVLLPTSLPVPAVVGRATKYGKILFSIGLAFFIPS